MRPSKREYYLEIASTVAKRSTCLRRQYGAVIVANDRIVATGYNGTPRGADNCCDVGTCKREDLGIAPGERYELCEAIHAEMNACLHAGRDACVGATLYLAGWQDGEPIKQPQPCAMCDRIIRQMGISGVIS